MDIYKVFKRITNNWLLLIVIIIIVAAVPVGVKAYTQDTYNKLVLMGQKAFLQGQYEEADKYLSKALKYSKKDIDELTVKINTAQSLKASKEKYEEGMKLFKDKKYTEAIAEFKKISIEDSKNYSNGQVKINEASKLFVQESIEKAKTEARNKRYNEAIAILESALSLEPSNKEALNIKEQYNKELQKNTQGSQIKVVQTEQEKTNESASSKKATSAKRSTSSSTTRKNTTTSTSSGQSNSSTTSTQTQGQTTESETDSQSEQPVDPEQGESPEVDLEQEDQGSTTNSNGGQESGSEPSNENTEQTTESGN